MNVFSFRLSHFIALNVLALLLVFSWHYEVTRFYWDALDQFVFVSTNQLLVELHSSWGWFWAILSIRVADLMPLLIILWFFYTKDVIFSQQKKVFGFVGFVLMLVLMLFVRELLDLYVEVMNLNRASPTIIVDSAIRLSLIYPNFNLKDSSGDSFPGDHAAVLLTWLGYSLFFVRNKWSIAILLLVILFSLPRLMAGAHWLSDIMVGGLSIALVTFAFGLYTPLLNNIHQKSTQLADNILNKIFKL